MTILLNVPNLLKMSVWFASKIGHFHYESLFGPSTLDLTPVVLWWYAYLGRSEFINDKVHLLYNIVSHEVHVY